MEIIRFGRWELSCDPEATRKAHAALTIGGPEECGCETCLNFIAARDQVYASDVLALLQKMGISPNREVEVVHMARLDSHRHLYSGWFHFVGSIISGSDVDRQDTANGAAFEWEEIGKDFRLGFRSKAELVRQPFTGLPLAQLEFTVEVPWVVTTTEPER